MLHAQASAVRPGVIGGLFFGGVLAYQLVMAFVTRLPQLRYVTMFVTVGMPRRVQQAWRPGREPPVAPPCSLLGLAALCGWQAVDEAALRPARERALRPGRAAATVVAVQGADVTLAFTPAGSSGPVQVVARNTSGQPPPAVQSPWPHEILYDPARPGDALVRDPVVFWGDVAVLTTLAAAAVLLALYKPPHRQAKEEAAKADDATSDGAGSLVSSALSSKRTRRAQAKLKKVVVQAVNKKARGNPLWKRVRKLLGV